MQFQAWGWEKASIFVVSSQKHSLTVSPKNYRTIKKSLAKWLLQSLICNWYQILQICDTIRIAKIGLFSIYLVWPQPSWNNVWLLTWRECSISNRITENWKCLLEIFSHSLGQIYFKMSMLYSSAEALWSISFVSITFFIYKCMSFKCKKKKNICSAVFV